MSCAIANAVFDTIERENLREHALVVGEYLFDACQMLAKKHMCIGDVRGMGLFLGIELVKDRELRIPDKETATYVVSRYHHPKFVSPCTHVSFRMRAEHILVSSDGPDHNVIKIKPPMVFNKENVDEFVSTLDRVLKERRESSQGQAAVKGTETPSKEGRTRKPIKEERIKSI